MKTGVLLNDMSASDKNYHILKTLNNFVESRMDETFAFILNVSKKVIPTNFAYSNCAEVSNFHNGVLIATSLETADVLKKCCVSSDKCFYIWSIDWLSEPHNFTGLKDIISDKNIKIIVRSQLQADIINNNYGVVVDGIDEDFNLEKINGICKKE